MCSAVCPAVHVMMYVWKTDVAVIFMSQLYQYLICKILLRMYMH